MFIGKENVVTHCEKMLSEMDGLILTNSTIVANGNLAAIEGY